LQILQALFSSDNKIRVLKLGMKSQLKASNSAVPAISLFNMQLKTVSTRRKKGAKAVPRQ
jgi:hypothetical protein